MRSNRSTLTATWTSRYSAYNNRATKDNPLNDADRFMLAVSQIAGKRLTYAELTGKVGETTQSHSNCRLDEASETGEAEALGLPLFLCL